MHIWREQSGVQTSPSRRTLNRLSGPRSNGTSQDSSRPVSDTSSGQGESLWLTPRHVHGLSSVGMFSPISALSPEACKDYLSHSHSFSGLPETPIPCTDSRSQLTPESHHLRQSSIIVKNVNQTYSQMLAIIENPDDSNLSSPSKGDMIELASPRMDLIKTSLIRAFNESAGLDSTNEASEVEVKGRKGKELRESRAVSTATNGSLGREAKLVGDEEQGVAEEYSGSIRTGSHPEPIEGASSYFTDERVTQCGLTTANTDSEQVDLEEIQHQRFKYEREIRLAKGKLLEQRFGLLPTRTYCDRCQMDVSTRVSMELPKVPM